ncbi:MAG: phosphomannomutase/phosphoglucomutase [Rickettsia endosymbiont of Bryobia graminum]|nr:phosphomannomutase/phosphoglucomutase [Rickettsia endosymbiont of Bryobia graminum]
MKINRTIFKSYDIRGNSLSDLNQIIAYKIGFCFAKMHIIPNNNIICVGRDGRLSSPTLYIALVNGIIDAGGEVINIGIAPSPILYFADKILKPKASIMITGSHNPKDDNGFKMIADGLPFYDEQIQDLLNIIIRSDFSNMPNGFIEPINIKQFDLTTKYLEKILQDIAINPKLKVAWDPANGAAGNITELLKEKLPNQNFLINSHIDGNFPNHHPDPTILNNLNQLIKLVKTKNCDIGIAFDGDADRIAIISSKGQVVFGEQILAIFARDIITTNPGATIITDIKTSASTLNYIKDWGGDPILWKTGHSYIKDKLRETNALLAGEISGHIFFADKYYGYDDGIYAALRLLDLLTRSDKTLDEILEEVPQNSNVIEISIHIAEEIKFIVIEEIKQKLKERHISFIDIDGVRVTSEIGWWLIRSSNTEAKITARYEANTKDGLAQIKEEIISILNSVNIDKSNPRRKQRGILEES